jgi:hypothetical protein
MAIIASIALVTAGYSQETKVKKAKDLTHWSVTTPYGRS